jgi:hypothetical protein
VLVIVGVSVMVGDSRDVDGVRSSGVSEGGTLVDVSVGVKRLGAWRTAVHPAQ